MSFICPFTSPETCSQGYCLSPAFHVSWPMCSDRVLFRPFVLSLSMMFRGRLASFADRYARRPIRFNLWRLLLIHRGHRTDMTLFYAAMSRGIFEMHPLPSRPMFHDKKARACPKTPRETKDDRRNSKTTIGPFRELGIIPSTRQKTTHATISPGNLARLSKQESPKGGNKLKHWSDPDILAPLPTSIRISRSCFTIPLETSHRGGEAISIRLVMSTPSYGVLFFGMNTASFYCWTMRIRS
jgi:hypothetical protein